MDYTKIENHVRCVKRERYFSIFVMSMGIGTFVPLAVLFVIKNQIGVALISLLCLAMAIFGAYLVRRDSRLIKQLLSISENKTINKTRDVELYSPKVVFVPKTEVYQSYFTMKYFAIRLVDENKNTYYYFLNELMSYNKNDGEQIKKKFSESITVQCYENTNIIKTIENDPYFLRIKLGFYYR